MNIFFRTGAQKFMGAQKLRRGRDASASLRHPQMAPGFELRAWDRQTDRRIVALLSARYRRHMIRIALFRYSR